jgi:hypothetical protein
MTHENFKKLLEELDGNASETLAEKNARYSSSDDALHNFKSGAEIMGGTPAQACWGYLTKHLTALRDMIQRDDFNNRDDFLEKVQDSMNYLRFIWALGNESLKDKIKDKFIGVNDDLDTCYGCAYSNLSENSFPCSKCKRTTTNKEEYQTRLNYYKKLDN